MKSLKWFTQIVCDYYNPKICINDHSKLYIYNHINFNVASSRVRTKHQYQECVQACDKTKKGQFKFPGKKNYLGRSSAALFLRWERR